MWLKVIALKNYLHKLVGSHKDLLAAGWKAHKHYDGGTPCNRNKCAFLVVTDLEDVYHHTIETKNKIWESFDDPDHPENGHWVNELRYVPTYYPDKYAEAYCTQCSTRIVMKLSTAERLAKAASKAVAKVKKVTKLRKPAKKSKKVQS